MLFYPLPNKKYNIIYVDPPWDYKDKALAGARGANCKYPTLDITSISKLDVPSITAENAILFLWVTFPQLENGLQLIKNWGFTYKTIAFTWVKRNKKANTWFFGMGNWTRSNAEICLLAIKGKPKRINASISSIIDTPIEEHSKKPAIVRDKIVELCGDIPRIELFARQKTEGWDVWGNAL